QNPEEVLAHFRDLLRPGGVAYVTTPNVLTLAPPGAQKSDNPWHVKEYRAHEFRELCESVFDRVELLGLFHARKLRVHELAIRHLGWDAVHKRPGIPKPFHARFTPAISQRDFRPAPGPPARPSRRSAATCSAPSATSPSAARSRCGPPRPLTACCRCSPPRLACTSRSATGRRRTSGASAAGRAASGCRSAPTGPAWSA